MNTISTNNQPLPDFLGIEWGASRDVARSKLCEREGVVFNESQSGQGNQIFQGGLYANKDVKMWVLQFVNNKLHTAKILVAPPAPQTIDVFKDLSARLTREYGEPAQGGIIVNRPYSTGQELQAIAAGKGIAAALYAFGVNNRLEGSILCQVAPNGQIVINYQNESLNREAISSQSGLDAPVEGMPTMQTQASGGGAGGCFIATAAIGNQHHPVLYLLRAFRDYSLGDTTTGRLIIRLYYALGPFLSVFIRRQRLLRAMTYRWIVFPMATWVSRKKISRSR